MAWPIDAILRTYAALSQVFSDDLNAIQNRIVDLHRERAVPIVWAAKEATGTLGWTFDTAQAEYGHICVTAASTLVGLINLPNGAKLKSVSVKVRNDGAASMVGNLYEVDHKIGNSTTAPAKGSTLATDAAAGSAAWDVIVLNPTDHEVADYTQLIVEITAASADDMVAAGYAVYEPITPTP